MGIMMYGYKRGGMDIREEHDRYKHFSLTAGNTETASQTFGSQLLKGPYYQYIIVICKVHQRAQTKGRETQERVLHTF